MEKKNLKIYISFFLFLIFLGLTICGIIIKENKKSDIEKSEISSIIEPDVKFDFNNIVLPTKSLYDFDKVEYENKTESCIDEDGISNVCSKIYIDEEGIVKLYDEEIDTTFTLLDIEDKAKYLVIDEKWYATAILVVTNSGDLYISGFEADRVGELSYLSDYVKTFVKVETNYKFTNIWSGEWAILDEQINDYDSGNVLYALTTSSDLRLVLPVIDKNGNYIGATVGNTRENSITYVYNTLGFGGSDDTESFDFYLSKYGYIQVRADFDSDTKFIKNYILDESDNLILSKKIFGVYEEYKGRLYIINTEGYLFKLDYISGSSTSSSSKFVARKVNENKIKSYIEDEETEEMTIKYENNKTEVYDYIVDWSMK